MYTSLNRASCRGCPRDRFVIFRYRRNILYRRDLNY